MRNSGEAIEVAVSSLEPVSVFGYGAECSTQLVVTANDPTGDQYVLVLDETAFHQLAQLIHKIGAQLPGAVRGH